jgi:Membrane domain of glycerophosphoryl diester phosphodiesterase
MALDLRPLTLPELLDRSFSTYRRHVWLFVGIMAAPAAIGLGYGVMMQLVQFSAARIDPTTRPEDVLWRVVPMMLAALAFFVVYMIVYAFALAATTVAVARVYSEQAVTIAESYSTVRSQGLWLLLVMIWAGIRVMLVGFGVFAFAGILAFVVGFLSRILGVLILFPGMFAAFVVVVYFSLRYGVAVPAAVLENLGPNRALKRSVELTEEYRGRIFLIMLCSVVITYATMALLQMPFIVAATLAGPQTPAGLTLNMAGIVLGTAGSTFTGPIMMIGLALAYYDLRIRKEAFDLQMMLAAIDAPHA